MSTYARPGRGQILIDPEQLLGAFGLIAQMDARQARVVSFQHRGAPKFYDVELEPYPECHCGRAVWRDERVKGPCKHVLVLLMASGYHDVIEAAEAMVRSQPVEITKKLSHLSAHLSRQLGAEQARGAFEAWVERLPQSVQALASLVVPQVPLRPLPVAREAYAARSR